MSEQPQIIEKKRPTLEEIIASPRSTFVDVPGMPWKASKFPGVEVKILYEDAATGMLTVMTRMAPGSFIPLHTHPRAVCRSPFSSSPTNSSTTCSGLTSWIQKVELGYPS